MTGVRDGRPHPTGNAALSRRATDVPVGTEIVRFIVDDANAVQFSRSHDAARIPTEMRWPAVMHRNILDVIPTDQLAGFHALIEAVRATKQPAGFQFPSSFSPGELRAAYAQTVCRHPGWVSVAVFDIAVAVKLPAELEKVAGGSGGTGTCLIGTMALAQQIASWLF
jgi:hypothetical protein